MPGGTQFAPTMGASQASSSLQALQSTAALELSTLNAFLRQPTSDLIRRLYDYLNANGQQYTALINITPVVAQAAQLYGAGDYVNAFNITYQAYRSIALLRMTAPNLPPL